MTTLSESSGSMSPPTAHGTVKYHEGTDGKFDFDAVGNKRIKWNEYFFFYGTQHSLPRYWDGVYPYNIWAGPGEIIRWNNNDELSILADLAEVVRGSDFNAAVSMAEAKQTVGLVVNTLKQFRWALSYARRGRFKDAAESLGVWSRKKKFSSNTLAERWLELQYGWKPLLSDVYEASKAFADKHGMRVTRYRVKKTVNHPYNSTRSPGVYDGWGTARCSKVIIAELYEDLSSARALGLENPSLVLWEKIPYSFVVDWFIPIGTYLDNLNVIPKLKGRFLSTLHCSYRNNAVVKPDVYDMWPPNWAGAEQTSFTVTVWRQISTSLSVPMPSFKKLSDAASPLHVWNAIALTSQFFSRQSTLPVR